MLIGLLLTLHIIYNFKSEITGTRSRSEISSIFRRLAQSYGYGTGFTVKYTTLHGSVINT